MNWTTVLVKLDKFPYSIPTTYPLLQDGFPDDLDPQHECPEVEDDVNLNVSTGRDDDSQAEQNQVQEVEKLKFIK